MLWQLGVKAQSLPTNNGGADAEVSFDYRNMVPGMPENSGLGAYGNIPMNTSSGLPNINFNLYTLTEDGVSVPISISYLANGIKYNDIPSCVGLKWTLDCGGSINRSINGFADEDYLYANMNRISDSAFDSYLNYNTSAIQSELKQIANNSWDVSLDNYYYSLPSGRQGEMYFTTGGNGQFLPYRDYTKLKIQVLDSNFTGFKITDENGVQYFFQGGGDYSRVFKNGIFDKQANNSAYGLTAWKISKIITPNKRVINFQYQNYSYGYWSTDGQKWTYYTVNSDPTPDETCNCGTSEGNFLTTQYSNIASVLTKVYTDDEEVDFNYTSNPNLEIWQDELSNIKVVSKVTGDTVKEIVFNYNSSGILELNSYSEIDPTGHLSPVTDSFSYIGTSGFPYTTNSELDGEYACSSLARDYFGYFNNAGNTALFSCSTLPNLYQYPLPLANRSVTPVAITQGILSTITYPTGGTTTFTYEPNTDTVSGLVYYAPGVRVKEVKDMDGTAVLHDKIYTYSGLQGGLTIPNLSCYPYTTISPPAYFCCQSQLFLSEINPNLTNGGFYYAKCVTNEVGGNSGNIYTKDYYLQDANLYGVLRGLLSRTEYYKNDTATLVQAKNYVYTNQVIDSESTSSYILAPVSIISGFYVIDNVEVHMCATTLYQGLNQQYNLSPQVMDKIQESTVTYGATSSDSVVAVKNYHYYSNPDLPQSTESMNSDGKADSTVYLYTTNFPSNTILNAMVDSNIIGAPVEQDYYFNQALLKKKLTDYKPWYGAFYNPDFETIVDVPSGKSQNYNYYNYDSIGNLLEEGKDYDQHTSYIWDYMHRYPVAQVTNAASSAIAFTSFEADGTGNWQIPDTTRIRAYAMTGVTCYGLNSGNTITASGLNSGTTYIVSYWSRAGSLTVNGTSGTLGNTVTSGGYTWNYYEHTINGATSVSVSGAAAIDELRLFPKGSLMTTYTYIPAVGMSSQCSPTNYITYYGYDGLSRLSVVKDLRGNIIKTYNYNYKQQ